MADEKYDDGVEHWPAVFYGPADHDGEPPQSATFNNPLEVPDGWHDHPAKVGDPKAKTEIPGYEEAVAAANESGDEDDGDEGEDDVNGDGVDPNEPGVRNSGADDLDRNIRETAERKGYVLPDIKDITKDEIIRRLETVKPKLSFNKNWNEQRLYDLLKDNLDNLIGSDAVQEGNKL